MAQTGIADRAARNGHAADEGGAGLAGRLLGGLARQVQQRIPAADLDERDPDYIRESLPRQWLLASLWFRGEVRGLGNIPESGPVLLESRTVAHRELGDDGTNDLLLGDVLRLRWGVGQRVAPAYQVSQASRSVCLVGQALDSGAALLVYPGGDYEVHRPSWEGNRVDFGGRKGFIRLALEHDVPIVPVVSVGGQETALFLTRGRSLARGLGLDRLFRLKVLPISLALPWGINVGDFLGHIPLPAKITVEALPPIDLREEFGQQPDLDEVYDHVMRLMQDTLDALAAERRLPVLG